MKMESVEVQQAVEIAVTEAETQHITQAQIATLAQVTGDADAVWGLASAAGLAPKNTKFTVKC